MYKTNYTKIEQKEHFLRLEDPSGRTRYLSRKDLHDRKEYHKRIERKRKELFLQN